MWVYGINSVQALLETQAQHIEKIWFSRAKNDRRIQLICQQAGRLNIICQEQSIKKLDEITSAAAHQNIAAFCKIPDYLNERAIDGLCETADPIFLILDCITNPGNFGACLRTAEMCKVTAVIIPSDRAVGLTPAVIKTASGAVGRVRIVRVPNLVRVIKRMQEKGIWVAAAAASSTTKIYDMDYRRPIAFVLGSEGKGIRRLVREACDYTVGIPIYGKIESFNVSVAAAILLYEACRQRA